MVNALLVREQVEAGRELLRKIEQAGIAVTAAMWRFLPESDEWRLFIYSPLVDQLSSRPVYQRIQPLLEGQHEAGEIFLDQITVAKSRDPFVAYVSQRVGPSRQDDVPFSDNADDLLIYRLPPISARP